MPVTRTALTRVEGATRMDLSPLLFPEAAECSCRASQVVLVRTVRTCRSFRRLEQFQGPFLRDRVSVSDSKRRESLEAPVLNAVH